MNENILCILQKAKQVKKQVIYDIKLYTIVSLKNQISKISIKNETLRDTKS